MSRIDPFSITSRNKGSFSYGEGEKQSFFSGSPTHNNQNEHDNLYSDLGTGSIHMKELEKLIKDLEGIVDKRTKDLFNQPESTVKSENKTKQFAIPAGVVKQHSEIFNKKIEEQEQEISKNLKIKQDRLNKAMQLKVNIKKQENEESTLKKLFIERNKIYTDRRSLMPTLNSVDKQLMAVHNKLKPIKDKLSSLETEISKIQQQINIGNNYLVSFGHIDTKTYEQTITDILNNKVIQTGTNDKLKIYIINTSLHYLITLGDTARIQQLLKKNVDKDFKDKNGWTALHHAAFCDNEEIIRLLLNYKVNTNILNNDRTTAAMLCTEEKLKILIEKGIQDVNVISSLNKIILGDGDQSLLAVKKEFDMGRVVDINCKDKENSTLLYSAVCSGAVEVAKYLIEQGANPDVDVNGDTARKNAIEQENDISTIFLSMKQSIRP